MRNANEGVSLSEIVTKATLRKFGIRGVNKYETYTVIIITVAFFILESAAGRAKDTFAVAVKVLSYMLPCTAIIMAVIWIIFFIGDRREKLKHAELDVIKIKARQKIYDRLRYVEMSISFSTRLQVGKFRQNGLVSMNLLKLSRWKQQREKVTAP